ncbi:ECF RNA polymerase sigma factor SigE [Phycisphaerae bacterium RAS2]|nr:ECF RNA polymerase sigma factor SigE [Phycisphaerae bacterium RAS2]
MIESEDDLVKRAVGGDMAALATLLEQNCAAVRAMLNIDRKWASVLDPDDVLQVTCLEAFLQIGKFNAKGPGAFLGWLSRIAQNNLCDAVRELSAVKRSPPGQRIGVAGQQDSTALLLANLGMTTTTPSRNAASAEVCAAINNAISLMPPDYGTVVRLYDLESMPIGDVAAAMKRTPGAVHMLRTRAHEHLREILGSDTAFFSQCA